MSPEAGAFRFTWPDYLSWPAVGLHALIRCVQPYSSPATHLRQGLQNRSSESPWGQELKSWVLGAVQLGGLISCTNQLLSPAGPGGCDHNPVERCANCVSSVPFLLVGAHAIEQRQTCAGKVWGASMCAVGAASINFHASKDQQRRHWARRLDYWSIAMASNLMTRALYPDTPLAITVASCLAVPFKPFLVSFANSAAMELKFLRRACQNKDLEQPQRLHAAAGVAGLAMFALEEFMPELPLVHCAWHCLSATAVATVNHLMADTEQQEQQEQQRPRQGSLRLKGGTKAEWLL
ncbi:hypothetical protein V8C86DRAFT_2448947 [Haematococcus lacustris]